MGKKKKTKQRILQISFGLCLIFFVVLIERLAVHPPGIYSYTQQGFKEFQIGISKETVLKKINRRKTIRIIQVCDPERIFELDSRKPFILSDELSTSDVWICHDRTGKDFLFEFRNGSLSRVLRQTVRFGKKEGSILFSRCNTDILNDIDAYLSTRESLTVYTDAEIQK